MTNRLLALAHAALLLAACGRGAKSTDAGTDPTWYRDVQPLVQARCASCHKAGGIGPFALTSYAEARPRAGQMAGSVTARTMPPWMPADTCSLSGVKAPEYKDSRALTQAEIDTVVAWAAAGAPEGDAASQVTADAGYEGLADATATLEPAEDFTPPSGTGRDVYRCFDVGPADGDVTGIEFLPGVAAEVHHAILFAGNDKEVSDRDAQDPGLGWECFGGPDLPTTGCSWARLPRALPPPAIRPRRACASGWTRPTASSCSCTTTWPT